MLLAEQYIEAKSVQLCQELCNATFRRGRETDSEKAGGGSVLATGQTRPLRPMKGRPHPYPQSQPASPSALAEPASQDSLACLWGAAVRRAGAPRAAAFAAAAGPLPEPPPAAPPPVRRKGGGRRGRREIEVARRQPMECRNAGSECL